MLETLGRYKILATIGQGAMGVVYKAIDPMIDRTVAIKTVNLSLSKDELEEYEARFQQEIKAAGRLNHPNIVTVYDVGRTDTFAYMAMEFLEGKELKDIMAESGRQTVNSTVDWIHQIAQGLAFAHDHDIIHRDVKPSNIMIVRGGYAKITDFGIARMPGSAVKTMTGLILGSPRYMSPEQVIGKNLDSRTDIFSLGVVLYEALTGTPPFDGDNVNAIMYSTVNTAAPAPSTANAEVPAMLDLIVAKALAKTVDERYQSMHEFVQDLAEVKRLLSSSTGRVIAKQTPPTGKTVTLEMGRYQKKDEEHETAKPLKLSKGFDSFDATMRLAAMTKQTEEFSQYISETKKMRAYKGEITGALGGAPSAPPAGAKADSSARSAVDTATVPLAQLEAVEAKAAAAKARRKKLQNLLPLIVIAVLTVIAVSLAVALIVR